jgi:hypothetical protein
MKRYNVPGRVGFAVTILVAAQAGATSVPTFDSGPVVVSHTDAVSFPDPSTVIFGHKGGIPIIVSRVPSGGDWAWYKTTGHHHTITGGYDGDPALAYIPTGGGGTDFMTCGHQAASPGHIYCTYLRKADQDHFTAQYGPYVMGTGTFNPGTSPVLVADDGGAKLWLFARGQNGQIWYAIYDVVHNSWNSWFQIPAPAGDSFASDPGATSTGDGYVIVCAHKASTSEVACDRMNSSGWAGWGVPLQPYTSFKPAMAKGFSSVFLFGIRNAVNPNFDAVFTTSPSGANAGVWGDYSERVGEGWGLSALSALANRQNSQPHTFAIGKAGDSTYWFIPGNPDLSTGTTLVWGNWTQLQVIN